VEGDWERGVTRKGGSLGKGYYGKGWSLEKGGYQEEVWGHQERSPGKDWFTWKEGTMIKEGHKKRWVTGKRKVIEKLD